MYFAAALLVAVALQSVSVSAQIEGGYALRVNGTCSAEMTDCGRVSRGDFHACCPADYVCKVWRGYIQACCPTEEDCQEQIEEIKVCANDDWNMYIQGTNNGFCCPDGLVGYETRYTFGRGICVTPGSAIGTHETELNEREQGDRGSSSSVEVSTSTTSRTRSQPTTFEVEPTETTSESEPEETETPEETDSSTSRAFTRTTPPGSSPTRSSATSSPTEFSGGQQVQVSGVVGPLLVSLLLLWAY